MQFSEWNVLNCYYIKNNGNKYLLPAPYISIIIGRHIMNRKIHHDKLRKREDFK